MSTSLFVKAQSVTVVNNTAIPIYIIGQYTDPSTTPSRCAILADPIAGAIAASTTVTLSMSDFNFPGTTVATGGTFDAIIYSAEDFNTCTTDANNIGDGLSTCFYGMPSTGSFTIQPPTPCSMSYSYLFPTYIGTTIRGSYSISGTATTITVN